MQESSINDGSGIKCVACCASSDELADADRPGEHGAHEWLASNYFKSAQW